MNKYLLHLKKILYIVLFSSAVWFISFTIFPENQVIKIMRRSLKPNSFKLWRKRVHTKSIKNRKMFAKSREKLNRQKIIDSEY